MKNENRMTSGTAVSIGAISKATNIPVNTLRTWERRYGFPVPARTTGGHRLYEPTVIRHLRLVVRALREGHRPSQILKQDFDALSCLLDQASSPVAQPTSKNAETARWHTAVRQFDANTLTGCFQAVVAEKGLMHFVTQYSLSFLKSIGDGWVDGILKIEHEHFASEVLRDFLTSRWRPMSLSAKGPVVVCASLPDEQHYLPLHLAACMLTAKGYRVIFLGANTPIESLKGTVESSGSRLIVLSCSAFSDEENNAANLQQLRDGLHSDITIWIGGSGSPTEVNGVTRFQSMEDMKRALESGG